MDKTDIFGFWRHFDDTLKTRTFGAARYTPCLYNILCINSWHTGFDVPLIFSVLFIPASFMIWRHFWRHRCSNMRRYQTFSVKFAVDNLLYRGYFRRHKKIGKRLGCVQNNSDLQKRFKGNLPRLLKPFQRSISVSVSSMVSSSMNKPPCLFRKEVCPTF